MASGTLGAEEQPRERNRWSEISKVYTRKIRKPNCNNTTNNNVNNNTWNFITTTVLTNDKSNEENKNDGIDRTDNEDISNKNKTNKSSESNNDDGTDKNLVADSFTANVNKNDKNNYNEKAPQMSSSPKVTAEREETNSLQLQQNHSHIETTSEDSSSLNRPEEKISNGNLEYGSERPMVSQLDDRVSIHVSAVRSTQVVRNLKRKLEDELDQVRKMARRLETKEIELHSYCSSEVGVRVNTNPFVGSSQFLDNFGLERGFSGRKATSDVGSIGFGNSRAFSQHLVSVTNNHHGVREIVGKEKRTSKANQYYQNSDFLLGMERLPPETNRKSKSSGGRKCDVREFDYGFGIDKQVFKTCSNLLQKLMRHKHGWVFNEPVDVKRLGLHDYFDIIKQPMDLGTVKTRLTKNWYKTPREFAEDVRLTFHNALTYNPEGQDVHIMAKELLRIFEEKWPAIEIEYDRKLRYEMLRDLGAPTATSRKFHAPAYTPLPMPLAQPLLRQPPQSQEVRHFEKSQSMPVAPELWSKPVYSVARTQALKKPKAKEPNKRDMTFEEKQKLSTNLQSLPSEKLDAIVQIIKKRNSALSQHDDEIEVDIDSVDGETLWELDRFVTNYKKSLSKHKRKAELALQARVLATQEMIPSPAKIEIMIDNRTANVASPDVPQEKYSDNGSGSSSSSSSGSESGSSSSDSNSSGYGSDGRH